MFLVDNPDLAILRRQFEHSDDAIGHELRGYGAALQAGEFLLAARDVLLGLDGGKLVVSTLRLDRNDELLAATTHPDV